MQARRDELRAMTPEGTPLSTPRSSARKAPGVSDLLRAGAAPAPLWADGDAPARASAEVKSQRSLLNALLDDSLRGAAAPAAGGRESVEVGADFSFVSSSVEVKKFGRKKPAPGDAEASPPPQGAARVGAWGVEGAEGAEGARHAASLVVGDLQLEDVDAGDTCGDGSPRLSACAALSLMPDVCSGRDVRARASALARIGPPPLMVPCVLFLFDSFPSSENARSRG